MADLWSEDEFDRVAKAANCTAKTMAVCRDVLVEGMSGVDAAKKHQTFSSHISRSVRVLNEQKRLLEQIDAQSSERLAISKNEAGQSAKALLGPKLIIAEAIIGNVYDGVVVAKSEHFFVQHIGRVGIVHALANLAQPLKLNVPTVITYPANGDKATVFEKAVGLAKQTSIER